MKLVLFLLAVVASSIAASPVRQLSEKESIDAWFSQTYLAQFEHNPFVRVVSTDGSSDFERVGFLISGEGEPHHWLDLGGYLRKVEEKDRALQTNFAAWASGHLKVLADFKQSESDQPSDIPSYSDYCDLYLISRVAAAYGLHDLEKKYFEEAKEDYERTQSRMRSSLLAREDADFTSEIKNNVASITLSDATVLVMDYRNPRSRALPILQKYSQNCSGTKGFAEGMQFYSTLQQMSKEDEEHRGVPITGANSDVELSELVFQLRNQQGCQGSNPGKCDVFLDPRSDKSPASQLEAAGLAAVPKLIDVLTDQTPSHSHRGMHRGKDALSVGEVAQQIITAIAHQDFGETNGDEPTEDQMVRFKTNALVWWRHVQEVGEENVLAESVRRGGYECQSAMAELVRRNPELALAALKDATRAKKDDGWLGAAVSQLRLYKSPNVDRYIRETYARGVGESTVLELAQAESFYDREMALDWVLKLWPSRTTDRARWDSPAAYIAKSNLPRAVSFLSTQWKSFKPQDLASNILDLGEPVDSSSAEIDPPKDPATLHHLDTAVEALLASQLLNASFVEGFGVSGMNVQIDPQVGDFAVMALNQRFPQKYPYHESLSPFEQKLQRVSALNIWRKGNGMAPMPLPMRPVVGAVDRATLTSRVSALESGSGAEAKRKLLELGLAAAGPLARYVASEKTTADVQEASSTLCSIVREVRVDPSMKISSALRDYLNGLMGHPLQSTFLTEAIPLLENSHVRGMRTMLYLTRDNDGCGISVDLHVVNDSSASSDGGATNTSVTLFSNGKEIQESWWIDQEKRFLTRALKKALVGPGLDIILVKLSVG